MNLENKLNLERAEQQKATAIEYVKEQLKYSVYLNRPGTNPCVYEQQLGSRLTEPQFFQKLKKLNGNFKIETSPTNSSKKYLYFFLAEDRIFITAFDVLPGNFIAERSIMSAKEEEVPDLDFVKTREVNGVAVSHIDKADIPKSEWDADKGELVFEGNQTPGFKKENVVYTEAYRGWRTVLAYIVKWGICTPSEVERVFGIDNTPQWKRNMGKGAVAELF